MCHQNENCFSLNVVRVFVGHQKRETKRRIMFGNMFMEMRWERQKVFCCPKDGFGGKGAQYIIAGLKSPRIMRVIDRELGYSCLWREFKHWDVTDRLTHRLIEFSFPSRRLDTHWKVSEIELSVGRTLKVRKSFFLFSFHFMLWSSPRKSKTIISWSVLSCSPSNYFSLLGRLRCSPRSLVNSAEANTLIIQNDLMSTNEQHKNWINICISFCRRSSRLRFRSDFSSRTVMRAKQRKWIREIEKKGSRCCLVVGKASRLINHSPLPSLLLERKKNYLQVILHSRLTLW